MLNNVETVSLTIFMCGVVMAIAGMVIIVILVDQRSKERDRNRD